MPSSTRKQLLGFIIFALLLVGLSLATLFLGRSQDARQQAFVGVSDVNQYCPGGECVGTVTKLAGAGEYQSESGIYSLRYNPAFWQSADLPPQATATDQEQSFFVSKTRWGFATLYLTASPYTQAQQGMNLEQFAADLETQIGNALTVDVNYLGWEELKLDARPVIRFEFAETILGQPATYYEYVLIGDDYYLEAETRSSDTAAMTMLIKAFLTQVRFEAEPQILGVSDDASFNELELTELVKPSVANILHLYCKEVAVNADFPSNYLKTVYPFCSGGYGSGFIVSETGLIATNGHVVTTYPEEDFVMGLSLGQPAFVEFVVDFVRELAYTQGLETTPEEGRILTANTFQDPVGMQIVLDSMFQLLYQGAFTVEPVAEVLYVNLGTQPFEFTSDEVTAGNISSFVVDRTAIFPAQLVGADFANLFAKEVVIDGQKPTGSDVALLQVDASDGYQYPSLKLGDVSNLKEGAQILIFGFPGAVSGQEEGLSLVDYASSSTKVTVTKGIVSSIKQDTGGRTLIQTDASIGHGNSGGPAFNDQGEVIGIATYGVSEDVGTFNFLRDIGDLLQLGDAEAASLSEEPSQTYLNWQAGLEYFWANRFTKSLDYLNLIAESYPIHPTVNEVIDDAQQGIKEGRDVDLLFGVKKEYVYLGVGLLAVAVIASLAMLMMKSRRNRLPPSSPPPVDSPPVDSPPVTPPSPPSTPETILTPPIPIVINPGVTPVASPPASPALQ